eukprot:415214_1
MDFLSGFIKKHKAHIPNRKKREAILGCCSSNSTSTSTILYIMGQNVDALDSYAPNMAEQNMVKYSKMQQIEKELNKKTILELLMEQYLISKNPKIKLLEECSRYKNGKDVLSCFIELEYAAKKACNMDLRRFMKCANISSISDTD